jgi:hypothetical protein
MQALGLSDRRALLVIGVIGLASPFLGLMLDKSGASTPYQFFIFLGCFVMYCVLMSQAWRVADKLEVLDIGHSRQQAVQLVSRGEEESNINISRMNKNQ